MSEPHFHPRRIRLGTAALLLGVALLVWQATSGHTTWLLQWVIQIALVAGALVMKWASPRLPWTQVALAGCVVFGLHWLGHVASAKLGAPMLLLADHAIEFLCVGVIGRSWVKKGFIPAAANAWH